MRKSLIYIIAAFFFHSCSTPQKEANELDKLMSAYTNLHQFNGTVLVAHKGEILLDKGYGWLNTSDSARHDKNSIFQIGSITKQFTATVILKLQEENKLSAHDRLSKYFPDYPKGDSITLQQMLTHTSGIYSYTNDENFMANEVTKPSDRGKMMALFKDRPLQFSPGTGWDYSNSAYVLLGYIIEDVAKMPYEQAIRKYIFGPLHMDRSGFDFTHLNSKDRATGYFRLTGDANTPAPVVDSSVSYSAGAIYSTTADMYKWHQSLQGNTIITIASKQTAHTPVKNKYGYGWVIDTAVGKRTIGHGGGIHGFTSNMVSIPDDNTCIILLNNVSNPNLQKITEGILAILYNKPYDIPKVRTAITLPEDVLKQYTGVYELEPELIITVSVENGKLMGKPAGQDALQFHPEKEDAFFLKEIDAQVKFTRNAKKEVTEMTLYQNGKEKNGKKK